MTVSSARDLADLIDTLSTQFSTTHAPGAHGIWTLADTHITHAVQEGGPWISSEIRQIEQEWQVHRQAVQNAQQWFEHHVSLLRRVAADALKLSTEAFAAGGSTTVGRIHGVGNSIGTTLYVYGPAGAIGGYLLTATGFLHDQKIIGGGQAFAGFLDKAGKITGGIGAADSFGRAIQAYHDGDFDRANRDVIDGVIGGVGTVVPPVAVAKMAWDGGWELGKIIDGGDQHRISGPMSDEITSYAQEHGHGDEAHRYDGPVGFLRFGRDGVGAAGEEAKHLLSGLFH